MNNIFCNFNQNNNRTHPVLIRRRLARHRECASRAELNRFLARYQVHSAWRTHPFLASELEFIFCVLPHIFLVLAKIGNKSPEVANREHSPTPPPPQIHHSLPATTSTTTKIHLENKIKLKIPCIYANATQRVLFLFSLYSPKSRLFDAHHCNNYNLVSC